LAGATALIRFWRLLLTGALALALVSSFGSLFTLLPTHAQGSADDKVTEALKQATFFLGKQLGRNITVIDTFSYELATFPDAALGCPEPGKTYKAESIQGYKFFISFGGITYEVHTSLDGSRSVLCTQSTFKQEVTFSTYRSPLFSLPYPNRWNSIDRVSDIFFGLGNSPICSQPGMTVTALGSVTTGKTADALLDEYARTTSGIKYDGERIAVGTIGRSAVYTAPCTDGSPRMTRVAIFVAYGRAYRILQFAPQNGFNQWSGVFLKILEQFSPGVAGNSSGGQPVTQPDVSPLEMVALIFGGNVYIGTLADLPGSPITTDAASDHVYRDVSVSPVGDRIAYVDPAAAALYVATVSRTTLQMTNPPRKIAEKLAPGFPLAWSPDGKEIGYLADEGAKDGERAVYSVMAAKVAGDSAATRKIADTQRIKIACAINTSDPAERLYWSEVGINGNRLVLFWLRDGSMLYSLGCDGIGVGQIGSTGERSVLDPTLRRVQVSPRGDELIGVNGNPGQPAILVRLNLQSKKAEALTTTAPPEQAAWSADGKAIYYSTATLIDSINLDDEKQRERGLKAFGTWPFKASIYSVTLRRLDLTSQADIEMYKASGQAIANISPGPDGSGLLFTFIQGAGDMVEAFKINVSAGDLRRQAPVSLLYWLSFISSANSDPSQGAQPQLLAVTSGPAWGPLGSGPAPTPTSSSRQPTFTPGAVLRPSRTPSVVAPPTNTRQPANTPSGTVG
jgi:hypothetical protein